MVSTGEPTAVGQGRIVAAVTTDPIDPQRVISAVATGAAGATLLFLGTVRREHQGRAVTGMEYAAYVPMAERVLGEIATEAITDFSASGVAVIHRIGALDIGAISVAIAVSHPHRGKAYDASRYVIEELKKRAPIWKLEYYEDGTREWVDPTRGNTTPETGT